MLPLPLSAPPATAAELAAALQKALLPLVSIAPPVVAEGDWPDLRSLSIDLSGGKIPASLKPPASGGEEVMAFTAAKVELKGLPIQFQDAKADLLVHATGVRFSLRQAAAGSLSLGLAGVGAGDFSLSIAHASLEALIQAVARKAAQNQGVEIERVRLEISSEGPSAVSFRARIIAHKLFMSTAISLTGRLSVDASLVAHLSQLSCSGSGLVGTLAGNFIRPYLDRLNERAFPLTGFALGETRVTGLRLDPGEPLRITASFGAA